MLYTVGRKEATTKTRLQLRTTEGASGFGSSAVSSSSYDRPKIRQLCVLASFSCPLLLHIGEILLAEVQDTYTRDQFSVTREANISGLSG